MGDVDLLLLGDPDRDVVYSRVAEAEPELGYPVQVTFRRADWFETGTDSFHDTVMSRPLVQIAGPEDCFKNASAAAVASVAH